MNNSITAGDKAIKFHVWNGSKTLCNRMALNKVSKQEFALMLEKYPAACCAKCKDKLKIN